MNTTSSFIQIEQEDYICEICKKYPDSHSFYKIKETNDGVSVFYTCPAKAKLHDDYDGILNHYNGMLQNNGNKPWIWIFDAKGFSIKHAMEVNISIAIAKLISSKPYSDNLQKIIIANPTWHINTTLKIIMPFLGENVKNKIHKAK